MTWNMASEEPLGERQLMSQLDTFFEVFDAAPELKAGGTVERASEDDSPGLVWTTSEIINLMSDGTAVIFDVTSHEPCSTPRLVINR